MLKSRIALIAALSFLIVIPAQAGVIYTPAPGTATSSFSVDGAEFSFPVASYIDVTTCLTPTADAPPIPCAYSAGEIFAQGDSVLGYYGYAASLASGYSIDASSPYINYGAMLGVADIPYSSYQVDGFWPQQVLEYIGLRVQSANSYNYGWALVEIDGWIPELGSPNSNFYANLYGYAYESCPDQKIVAGDENGGASCNDPPASSVPEPSDAWMLLVGLSGLVFWRRVFHSAA